ncbi:F-box/FBD/LRR-repeat protein At1g13570-like [Apium graveolens]|uniref:F-box/FBD/LRR-repeat protein At1g13570-like n=1 Tax=Apium graveolens TaxID=4045 RepID=UPI003D7BB985
MAESNRRKGRRVKEDIIRELPQEDIISELPQHLRETILGLLPLRDAVRTSVLSRKWRHCWTTIPHLIFEHEFVDRIMDKLVRYDDPEMKACKLVSVINKILKLHNGPIHKFSFSFCEQDLDTQIIHDYIDQWIPLFSRKGIKQLALEDLELGESSAHNFFSLDLTQLKLINFWLPCAPTSGVFPHLTNLELIQVEHLAASGQQIFDFPVLEKLTLILCDGLLPTNFCAPKLRCLQQLRYDITSEYSLAGFGNLTEYSFGLLEESRTWTEISNVNKVLGSLPKIEKFYIAIKFMQFLAAGGSPKTLSKPLPFLKILNISNICFNKLSEVSCLLCLIRSAPNLCKLSISAEHTIEDDLEKYQIEDSEACTMDNLEIVTLSDFKGLTAELELVKFLLASSPLLKTMFIHFSRALRFAASKRLRELLQYPKASSRVQIKQHLVSDDMDDFGAYCLYYC